MVALAGARLILWVFSYLSFLSLTVLLENMPALVLLLCSCT